MNSSSDVKRRGARAASARPKPSRAPSRAAPVALTEFEGAALAVIAQNGPCTPYALKEAFRGSPSAFWSGSAGAVYPLVRRLEKAGCVESRADRTGARPRQLLTVTPRGRAALAAWIADAEKAARFGFDPLRTRLLFADLLTPARRRRFLDEVRDALAAPSAPPASPAPYVAALHAAWSEARRRAFEASAAALEAAEARPRRR